MGEWVTVSSCDTYEINRSGAVRRIDTGRIKQAVIAPAGYLVVNLWKANKGTVLYVHRLLAEAFIGPCPPKGSVNHIDGDRLNNSLENLEYMSLRDNSQDQWAKGRGCSGERNGHAKLSREQAQAIHSRANSGERTCDLAREFGLDSSTVSQIKNGARWGRHVIASARRTS